MNTSITALRKQLKARLDKRNKRIKLLSSQRYNNREIGTMVVPNITGQMVGHILKKMEENNEAD